MPELKEVIDLLATKNIILNPAEIAEISTINDAIQGTREELEQLLFELEKDNRENWAFGKETSGGIYENTKFAHFPEHDGIQFIEMDLLLKLHEYRYQFVKNLLAFKENLQFQDGGIKTYERAKKKMDQKRQNGRSENCLDLSRFRIITFGLPELEQIYYKLLDLPFFRIGTFSPYLSTKSKYNTPFRDVKMIFCETSGEKIDLIATEIQLVTNRVNSILKLDHPFNVSKILEYPSDQIRDYVINLMLKASILDFQELVNQSTYKS